MSVLCVILYTLKFLTTKIFVNVYFSFINSRCQEGIRNNVILIFNISGFRLGLLYFRYNSRTFLSFYTWQKVNLSLLTSQLKCAINHFLKKPPRLIRFVTEVISNNIIIQTGFHPLENERQHCVQLAFLWFTEYKTIKNKKALN